MQILREVDQYERFRREDRPLEMVHLKLRTLIRDVAAALQTHPDNQELKDRLGNLKAELGELERRAPWIMGEYPVEICLWGPGAGLL